MAAHLAFGITRHAVGIECQQPAAEMAVSPAQLAQGDLQQPRLPDGVACEQFVNGGVGGNKWQSVGQFEAFLGKGALVAVGA